MGKESIGDKTGVTDQDQLIRSVLDSETFRKSPVLQGLLEYLWKHRTEELNEYAIGVEALRRPAGFNPRIDGQVRVQIWTAAPKTRRVLRQRGHRRLGPG